ncbi:MAG: NAD-dependent epimerase [Bacteroidales bacterium]|nr:NAD-dependent epimerase [Bacteroidales bacterium]
MSKILVTGSAGFIGSHLSELLLSKNFDVIGLDNINDYYDVNLKYGRLKKTGIEKDSVKYNNLITSETNTRYRFIKLNLEDRENINKLFEKEKFDFVVNLAAQAGVRYSIENPMAYIDSNIVGFTNILEACRHNSINHLVYASSSSVYGLNKKMPFTTNDNVDHPISLYAASKKSNELMAHTYSYLYKIPTTGLRFFTVYGPWGRPDMALFLFTKAILEGKPIKVYNNGKMQRDFTYIDDIVNGILKVIENPPKGKESTIKPSESIAPYKIYNIGNNTPVKLMDFIKAIENNLDTIADKEMLPMQAGDVEKTWADVSGLTEDLNYKPGTDINLGIQKFIEWYKSFYNINN